MNDDDVSARDEAASAYLDGDLDATERASVAADPETMARVEAFTRLRRTLSDTEPVADEVRDSAINAALAAFDVRQQIVASAPPHAARVTMLHTRWRRTYRVLGGLAAAAVVGIVAVAALNANGTDMKSSSATVPNDAGAGDQRIEMAAGSQPASAAGAPAATSAPAGTIAPAASTKIAAAELPAVNNEADLAQYAFGFAADAATAAGPPESAMSTATELVPMPATPPTACLGANEIVLGPISVLGAPAWAVRDTSTGVVRAIDTDGCRELLSTTP